ncbi:hypothetical protein DERP_002395 [Dermatophagoides pteronyssinus]|uniref:Uncharacterized protein n=1 Tax=Dermatophagoides pteronyssinus TaxID=6956 RepID=A0ABQ8JI02_DERPT|nr:hypothetical protein DERP_002395 [Dermatophagoides pteronyssinus]
MKTNTRNIFICTLSIPNPDALNNGPNVSLIKSRCSSGDIALQLNLNFGIVPSIGPSSSYEYGLVEKSVPPIGTLPIEYPLNVLTFSKLCSLRTKRSECESLVNIVMIFDFFEILSSSSNESQCVTLQTQTKLCRLLNHLGMQEIFFIIKPVFLFHIVKLSGIASTNIFDFGLIFINKFSIFSSNEIERSKSIGKQCPILTESINSDIKSRSLESLISFFFKLFLVKLCEKDCIKFNRFSESRYITCNNILPKRLGMIDSSKMIFIRCGQVFLFSEEFRFCCRIITLRKNGERALKIA